MTETLYKYRTIDNFKFFVEILMNSKLYAGKYKSMNDPMEGIYKYSPEFITPQQRNSLFEEKNARTFCCFSKDKDNQLLWSHYSNGHRGVVIGVKVDETKYDVRNIDYLDDFEYIDIYDTNTSIDILSKKLKYWEYENEVRVFTKNHENEIKVAVTEVILGMEMKFEDEILIKSLINKINPDLYVHKNFR
jgi:hypothetical protein